MKKKNPNHIDTNTRAGKVFDVFNVIIMIVMIIMIILIVLVSPLNTIVSILIPTRSTEILSILMRVEVRAITYGEMLQLFQRTLLR